MKDIIRGVLVGLLIIAIVILFGYYSFIYWFMCFIVWLGGQA